MELSKTRKTKYLKKFTLVAVVLFILILIMPRNEVQAFNLDGDTLDEDAIENPLLAKFAPRMYFTAGENFYPVDMSYGVAGAGGIFELWQWTTPVTNVIVPPDPTEATLTGYTDQYYLKAKAGYDYAGLKADYQSKLGILGYHVYGRVRDFGGNRYVQYWFFYIYNDGPINQHYGDWEMIQITCDTSGNAISAQYSQHHGGQSAVWAEVEKTGDHPHVYVAQGSHANYFRSYQGRVGLESDIVAADGAVITDADYGTVENFGELGSQLGGKNWLDYQGRFGNWDNYADGEIGFAGPYGPGYGADSEKMTDPVAWTSGLQVVDSTWFALCWFMYYLLYIVLAIFAILIIRKIYKIIKLKRHGGLLIGEVLKTRAAVGVLFGVVGIGLTVVAIFLPWYSVLADIDSPTITAAGEIFLLDGLNGVSVNFLITGTGMTPLFSLGIPFALIVGMGALLNALDIIGVDKPKKLGNGYIRSGFMFLILILIMVLLMMGMGALAGVFGITDPPGPEVLSYIGAHPFGGIYSDNFFGVVNITFVWGLALGGILLIAAAVVKIFAGLIIRSAPAEFA